MNKVRHESFKPNELPVGLTDYCPSSALKKRATRLNALFVRKCDRLDEFIHRAVAMAYDDEVECGGKADLEISREQIALSIRSAVVFKPAVYYSCDARPISPFESRPNQIMEFMGMSPTHNGAAHRFRAAQLLINPVKAAGGITSTLVGLDGVQYAHTRIIAIGMVIAGILKLVEICHTTHHTIHPHQRLALMALMDLKAALKISSTIAEVRAECLVRAARHNYATQHRPQSTAEVEQALNKLHDDHFITRHTIAITPSGTHYAWTLKETIKLF